MSRVAWIPSCEAQKIMQQNHGGRTVRVTYINSMAREGRIRSKPLGGNARLYYRPDVERIRLRSWVRK